MTNDPRAGRLLPAARLVDGPLFIGLDTHALSRPALATAPEVFAANDVATLIDEQHGFTPTPVISRAILAYNGGRTAALADRSADRVTPRPARPKARGVVAGGRVWG
jgi:phosphoglucomutase